MNIAAFSAADLQACWADPAVFEGFSLSPHVQSLLLVEFCSPAFATEAVICWCILPALFETLLSLRSCSFQAAAIPAVFACSFCVPVNSSRSLSSSYGSGGTLLLGCATHLIEKLLLFK